MLLHNLHQPAHAAQAGAAGQRPGGSNGQATGCSSFLEIFNHSGIDRLWTAVAQGEGRDVTIDQGRGHLCANQGHVDFGAVVDLPDTEGILMIKQVGHGAVGMLEAEGLSGVRTFTVHTLYTLLLDEVFPGFILGLLDRPALFSTVAKALELADAAPNDRGYGNEFIAFGTKERKE